MAIVSDGSGRPEGVKIYYDGKPQGMNVEVSAFKKGTIRNQVPLTIGSRSPGSPAHGCGVAGVALWGRAFSAGEVEGLVRGGDIANLVRLPAAERPAAAAGLYDWWLASADAPFKAAGERVRTLEAETATIRQRGTVAHVMNEKPEPAKAWILARGDYDKRLEEVQPDTPDILPAFPEGQPKNRLGLCVAAPRRPPPHRGRP